MFTNLIAWSQKHYSNLPWRRKRSLYNTLVSEIMLQQTTVPTVINYFGPFIERFPDLENLGLSREEEVLSAWRGLGYYRRAKNLRLGAVHILTELAGNIPTDYATLISIPGIGPYTANALLSIGQNKKALALDANLERVLARFYGLDHTQGLELKKELTKRFARNTLLPDMDTLGSRALTEALMDLGRTICRADRASCLLCPLTGNCRSHIEGNALNRPVRSQNKKMTRLYQLDLLRIVAQKKDTVLAYRKKEGEWLSGQLELPTFIVSGDNKDLTQYPWINKKLELTKLPYIQTAITKYRIKNYILSCSLKEFQDEFRYFAPHAAPYKLYTKQHHNALFSSTMMKILDVAGKPDPS